LEAPNRTGKVTDALRNEPGELFLFRLAGHLGRTKAELKATMSSHEFYEWYEYFQLEPFGFVRDAFNHAQAMSLHAQLQGNKTKYQDFLPEHLAPTKPKLTEEVLDTMFGL